MDSAHHGAEAWEQSYLEVMPANVWVLALKQAEHSEACTILRIQERGGTATKATLKSGPLGLEHTVDLAPWELKSLAIRVTKGGRAEVREVSLLES
jgi:alpha-mannosidase